MSRANFIMVDKCDYDNLKKALLKSERMNELLNKKLDGFRLPSRTRLMDSYRSDIRPISELRIGASVFVVPWQFPRTAAYGGSFNPEDIDYSVYEVGRGPGGAATVLVSRLDKCEYYVDRGAIRDYYEDGECYG